MSKNEKFDTPVLLRDVQMQRIFPDGKTFLDCLPKGDEDEINNKYLQQKDLPGFDLKKFVFDNFELPVLISNSYSSDPNKSVEGNIEMLWQYLTRHPDKENGSLIPLPYPYIV